MLTVDGEDASNKNRGAGAPASGRCCPERVPWELALPVPILHLPSSLERYTHAATAVPMHHLVIDDDWEDVHAHVLLPALMRRYLPLVTYYRYIRAIKTDTYMLQTRCQCTNSQSTMTENTCRCMFCGQRRCAGTCPSSLNSDTYVSYNVTYML